MTRQRTTVTPEASRDPLPERRTAVKRLGRASGVMAEILKAVTLPWTWLAAAATWAVALGVAFATRQAYPDHPIAQLAPQVALFTVSAGCAALGAVVGAHEFAGQWRTTLLTTPGRASACALRWAVRLVGSGVMGLVTSTAVLLGLGARSRHEGDFSLLLPMAAFFTLVTVFGWLIAEVTRSMTPAAVIVLLALWLPPVLKTAAPDVVKWLPGEVAAPLLTASGMSTTQAAALAAWLTAAIVAAAWAQRRDA